MMLTGDATCKWLGEINLRQGSRARDQFASLLLASQSSRFGVSLGLMGLTTNVRVTRDLGYGTWVDENLRVTPDPYGHQKLIFLDATSGHKFQLVPENTNFMQFLCMNEKWWLQIREEGNLLVITNLKAHSEPPILISIPDDYRVVESMSFSKLNSQQALMLMTTTKRGNPQQMHTVLAVVDIARTYVTKSLQIVSWNQCSFPQRYFESNYVSRIHLMKNKAGQNVFIVEIKPHEHMSDLKVVYAIQQSGAVTQLMFQNSSRGGLSNQLSGSLFSLCNHEKVALDIWDCNHTISFTQHTPLNTVERSSNFLAGSGLTCLIEDRKRLQVLDATTSGFVASIEVLHPGFELAELHSDKSLL
ncbi:hypothetical protein Pelo_16110 [Pelomyxa schiedti]|nr:hypothetical protein Pelo_16110 [Pelomyxa schiedti]